MSEKVPQSNPFELIENNGILVPRCLLESGREKDLKEYTEGWKAQSKSPVRLIKKTDFNPNSSAENWYQTGVVKYWINHGEPKDIESDNSEPQDLYRVMNQMRSNARSIPHGAFSKEDYGSDKKVDVLPYSKDVLNNIGQEVEDESHENDFN